MHDPPSDRLRPGTAARDAEFDTLQHQYLSQCTRSIRLRGSETDAGGCGVDSIGPPPELPPDRQAA